MRRAPNATYRIQLHAGFDFNAAAGISDYLASLGVSHLYASPYLQAAPGSTHGYDIVDPGRVNDELGGTEGHRNLCRSLRENGLGQILDIVANHMAVKSPENRWWWDVLENGPSSRYASYFDVDWDPPEARLSNKILLPILSDHYGRVLEAGEILLLTDGGSFEIRYRDHRFPVDPHSLTGIIRKAAERTGSAELSFIADSLDGLPLPTVQDRESIQRRHRDKEVIKAQFVRLLKEQPSIAATIDSVVAEYQRDYDLLDELLDEQNYRLAFWRMAERDLGYRRFFDISTLVGLRIEDEEVFSDTHNLILRWLDEGLLDGVRVDHPDGLRDPEEYFRRLRNASRESWVIAEKILKPMEKLPFEWPVDGTTGYDFINLVAGLFVDPEGEAGLSELYKNVTGEPADYAAVAHDKKYQVLEELLGSEVNRLTELMMKICERHRRHRDYTRHEIHETLQELIASIPVYRTYIRPSTGTVREEDRRILMRAVEISRSRRPDLDPQLFDFLLDLFFLKIHGAYESEFVMQFQQVTGPVAAKGIEDTAFYCFNRFLPLNEVGGDPAKFGVSAEVFHETMAEALAHWPNSMLSGSTHDTKRSEDVRARLCLLSEIPREWDAAVRRWFKNNERYRKNDFPDRNIQYLLYQSLLGAWPMETERLTRFMEKSMRESKVYTSWTRPNAKYEESVLDFTRNIMEDFSFQKDLKNFAKPMVNPGRINSLAQTLIRLTAPGVPDIYQGAELWDLSLVDPDNRRPVDFDLRRRLLKELEGMAPQEILKRMDEGLPKLYMIRKTLAFRLSHTSVFQKGEYIPLWAKGDKPTHVVAFMRGGEVITMVPRLVWKLGADWGETTMEIPPGRWRNIFTDEIFEGGNVSLENLLSRFPVALLAKE